MKPVIASVQPFMQEKVADALRIRGIHGDGKIFVAEVAQAIDIRTGAQGDGIL